MLTLAIPPCSTSHTPTQSSNISPPSHCLPSPSIPVNPTLTFTSHCPKHTSHGVPCAHVHTHPHSPISTSLTSLQDTASGANTRTIQPTRAHSLPHAPSCLTHSHTPTTCPCAPGSCMCELPSLCAQTNRPHTPPMHNKLTLLFTSTHSMFTAVLPTKNILRTPSNTSTPRSRLTPATELTIPAHRPTQDTTGEVPHQPASAPHSPSPPSTSRGTHHEDASGHPLHEHLQQGAWSSAKEQSQDVEGGWAWVVFTAAFLSFLISSAMFYSFSVFFVELVAAFGASRARTGWVYSTNSAVHMFFGPVGGLLMARWGPRATVMLGGLLAGTGYLASAFAQTLDTLFFTYGVINGMGTSLNYCGWVVGLGRFWPRRYHLVLGLAMSGSGFGVLLLGSSMGQLVETLGWRGAMLLCAGFSLNLSVLGATILTHLQPPLPPPLYYTEQQLPLMEHHKKKLAVTGCERATGSQGSLYTSPGNYHTSLEALSQLPCLSLPSLVGTSSLRSLTSQGSPETTNSCERLPQAKEGWLRKLLCWMGFWLLQGSNFLSQLVTTTIFAILLDWTVFVGLSEAFYGALAGIGAGDLLGRMVSGGLVSWGLSPVLLLCGVELLLGAMVSLAAMATTAIPFIAALVGVGIGLGMQTVLWAAIPSQLASGPGVGHVLGFFLVMSGAGALMGPPVAGMMVDLTNSYTPVLILCTAAPFTAAFLILVAHCQPHM